VYYRAFVAKSDNERWCAESRAGLQAIVEKLMWRFAPAGAGNIAAALDKVCVSQDCDNLSLRHTYGDDIVGN
jgi:hypothetical protein